MNSRKKSLASAWLAIGIVTSFATITSASSGAISGGGGKGVVCRDSSGRITSAQTLDLYEGGILHALNIRTSRAPMNDQIQQALSAIPANSRGFINVYATNIAQRMRLTPPNTQLVPIDDSFEVVLPSDCKAEQLANYYNDNTILVSADIWAYLDETNRAALVLHEAVYATERLYGAKDSRRTRHVVASLFDSNTHWTASNHSVPTDALNCVAAGGGLHMWAIKNSDGDWTLQFSVLGTSLVMSRKTTRLSSRDFDFEEAKRFPILNGEDKIGISISLHAQARSDFEDGDSVSVRKTWEPIKDRHGRIVPGLQTPRYYLKWVSSTYPNTSTPEALLNCSLQLQ